MSDLEPLTIDTISIGSGRIGMLACPGRQDPRLVHEGPQRSLAEDLDTLGAWGATQLVTLLHASELRLLEVPDLGSVAMRAGFAWLHLPLPDGGVPDAEFERRWPAASAELQSRLNAGQNIAVHCRAGLGRTGLVVARLLIDYGEAPAGAVQRVRTARPGTIETRAQERFLLGLRPA